MNRNPFFCDSFLNTRVSQSVVASSVINQSRAELMPNLSIFIKFRKIWIFHKKHKKYTKKFSKAYGFNGAFW